MFLVNHSLHRTRRAATSIAFGLTLSCLVFGARAQTDPVQAAGEVYEAFFAAMTNVEMDKVVSMFTDNAQFWGTNTKVLATDIEGVKTYFSALRGNQPGQNIFRAVDHSVVVLDADTLLLAGRWEVAPAATTTATNMRISMVLVQREGQWKIAQFHNSMLQQ